MLKFSVLLFLVVAVAFGTNRLERMVVSHIKRGIARATNPAWVKLRLATSFPRHVVQHAVQHFREEYHTVIKPGFENIEHEIILKLRNYKQK